MRCVIWAAAIGALAAAGCRKKSQDGMPPAAAWQSAQGEGSARAAPELDEPIPHVTPPPGMITRESNPHGGLAMGDPSNPHAGLDMDDDGEPDGPRGGAADVSKLGLAAPDPDRPIDPGHRIAGAITVDPRARARLASGTTVFLIVRRAGADGAPSGPPLAVDKLTWRGDGMAFELTEAQAMVAGTDLSGDVVVMARYDQDSDAGTRQPGDITGQVRVKIPAEHVQLTLDTVLP